MRPYVAQKNIAAILSFAARLLRHIDVYPAGEGKSHNQRRTHQESRLDALVHARFEIALAAEHTGADQIVLVQNLFDAWIERAAVADACGASIADQIEAKFVQVWLKPGPF